MRILIANEVLTGAGGVETYLATVVTALQAAGHDVGVLHDNPASPPGPQRIAPEGTWRAGIQDEGLAGAFARVRAFAPDVCFSHNMRTLDVDARLCREWPVVKLMHGHFGTCVSGHKAFAFPGVTACTRDFGPGCLAHYLPRRCGHKNPFVMLKQYAWGSEQRSLFDRYAAIVVASRFMRDEYLRAGAPPGRVHAIPFFAPPARALAGADDEDRSFDVVFVGRMTTLKGPDVLLEAVDRASAALGRKVSVAFAGEGPERDRLRERAGSRGIDAQFPGWLAPDDRDRLLRHATMIAVPSRWPEPFGLVGLEAATFGTPAVAFDSGGIPEWLTDDVNGRLVAPSLGAAGLGGAIADILGNPEIRSRLGAGARAAAARLTLDAHLRVLMAVLGRAAEGAID